MFGKMGVIFENMYKKYYKKHENNMLKCMVAWEWFLNRYSLYEYYDHWYD